MGNPANPAKKEGTAGAPRRAVPTPGSRLDCAPSVIVNARGSGGTAGASRPRPSPESCIALGTPVRGGCNLVGGPARGGRAGLAGVTPRNGRGATRSMPGSPYPSRHSRDTFPSGEGFLIARARAGLPYGRPASRGVMRSAMVERGGDLLRRPTEATHAPPAMHRCGELYLFGLVSCGDAGAARPRP